MYIMFYKFVILFMINFLFSQEVFTFTEGEVIEIESYIQKLEISDSLNTILIKNLEGQVKNLNSLNNNNKFLIQEQDSLVILLEGQVNSYSKLVKVVEPKWYDKLKWVLYGTGAGFLIGIVVE